LRCEQVEPILMRSYHWLTLLSAFLLTGTSFAQGDPDEAQDGPSKVISKDQQRTKFHPTAVKGMSAADWLAGYKAHLQMEAESPFGGIPWRSVGPEKQSGRVNVIAAPAGDPGKLYVGFATGGLYRTGRAGHRFSTTKARTASGLLPLATMARPFGSAPAKRTANGRAMPEPGSSRAWIPAKPGSGWACPKASISARS